MNNKANKIVALILAAGESSRMRSPKQNLPLGNTTLLNHTKEQLSPDIVDRTFIVLGAYADEIKQRSKLEEHEVIVFPGWKKGMGSSLAFACSQLLSGDVYNGILITVCDLPLVEKADYKKMCQLFRTDKDIVATKFNKTIGVPALFGKRYFADLKRLGGMRGAKAIIEENDKQLLLYKNDRAAFDIDTHESYEKILELSG